MELLPTEAVCNICSYLDVNSSVQLSLVSDFYDGCISEYVKVHRTKFIKCLREINAIKYHIGTADLVNYTHFGTKTTIEHNSEKDYSYRKIGENERIMTIWDYRSVNGNVHEFGYLFTVATINRMYSDALWVNVGETMPYNYAPYWKIFKKYNDKISYIATIFECETAYINQIHGRSEEEIELDTLLAEI